MYSDIYRLLCDVVANFQTNQEEISFIVNHDQISIRNFVDDEIGKNPDEYLVLRKVAIIATASVA